MRCSLVPHVHHPLQCHLEQLKVGVKSTRLENIHILKDERSAGEYVYFYSLPPVYQTLWKGDLQFLILVVLVDSRDKRGRILD